MTRHRCCRSSLIFCRAGDMADSVKGADTAGNGSSWHESDSFWEFYRPFLFTEEHRERAREEVEQVLELTGLEVSAPSSSSILDLGCGPGRHSIELARMGFAVTGVDRTSSFLDALSESARGHGLEIETVLSDMRTFVRASCFDLALSMYTSFGYFESIEDDLTVARNVYESLRGNGGTFLLDVMGKEVLARIFTPRGWTERDGVVQLQERRISNDWSRITNRWIVIGRDGVRTEHIVEHRVYSAVELTDLLERAGFTRCSVHGGLDGSPYDERARRLIVVARREPE